MKWSHGAAPLGTFKGRQMDEPTQPTAFSSLLCNWVFPILFWIAESGEDCSNTSLFLPPGWFFLKSYCSSKSPCQLAASEAPSRQGQATWRLPHHLPFLCPYRAVLTNSCMQTPYSPLLFILFTLFCLLTKKGMLRSQHLLCPFIPNRRGVCGGGCTAPAS